MRVAAINKKKAKAGKKKQAGKQKTNARISNAKKPENMTVSEWQSILRKQAAENTKFTIQDLTGGMAYGDYAVLNPETRNTYKVAIRSSDNSLNYCSCYDFKTNQLGTCKHIEAVMNFINKRANLRRLLQEPYNPAYSSMYMEYRGKRKIMFRIASDLTTAFNKLLKPYLRQDNSLNEKGYDEIHTILQKAFRIDPSFRAYDDALRHLISVREQAQRRKFLEPFIRKHKLPAIKSLKVKPFPYQIDGILFCAAAGRSILADDMGLGKTVQSIGIAQLLHEHMQVQKVLIICPTSLKYQWQSEINKFTTAESEVIEGNYLKRRQLYEKQEGLYKIISYNMAVNDIDLINDYQPDLIILDEAQRIKNWQTRVSRTLKKLQSKYCVVLTGTPIENKLQELYSLVQFVNPLLLGSLYNFISAHEQTDDIGKVVGYKGLDLIKDKLRDVLLRRTRSQVLQQLPKRMDKNLFVEITDEQKILHGEYQDQVVKLVNKWKRHGYLSEEERQKLLTRLNLMRMVCNSTFIIDQTTNHQTKLDELFDIIDEVLSAGEEKMVIFSQWERFTRLIALELDERKIGYANLNGFVPGNKRKVLFDRFNNDADCRIFLSTDAGGVGLNLQAGSWLINMDLPWNPAVLEQRIARIYRNGQTKPVNIINVIAEHTIEHGMIGKLNFKTALFKGVLDNGEPDIFMGDSKFNLFMKGVEDLMGDDSSRAAVSESGIPPEIAIEKEEQEPQDIDAEILDADTTISDIETTESVAQPALVSQPDFMQTASTFFSQFANILSDPKASQNLVSQLTRKDESTGQTFIQIPVANEDVVKQVVGIFAGLFKKS